MQTNQKKKEKKRKKRKEKKTFKRANLIRKTAIRYSKQSAGAQDPNTELIVSDGAQRVNLFEMVQKINTHRVNLF